MARARASTQPARERTRRDRPATGSPPTGRRPRARVVITGLSAPARARRRSCSRTSATTPSTTCRPSCSTASWRCATPSRSAIAKHPDPGYPGGDPAPAIQRARAALAARGVHAGPLPRGQRFTLVSRYSETRHRHPLQSRAGVQAGIAEERRRLAATRELADEVIDTSDLSIPQLKERLFAVVPRAGGRTRSRSTSSRSGSSTASLWRRTSSSTPAS